MKPMPIVAIGPETAVTHRTKVRIPYVFLTGPWSPKLMLGWRVVWQAER